ncbi:MAG: hypothetical protein IKL84_03380, partial [Clostridia bacterium]|nr:hypothetical protein [Clostridia bacterium]
MPAWRSEKFSICTSVWATTPRPRKAAKENPMKRKSPAPEQTARADAVIAALELRYPEAACALHWEGEPWRLLVMGRLSAQCTDARVNVVCEDLFARFPTLEAMADAPLGEIEESIRS